jgi:membrane-associated protein
MELILYIFDFFIHLDRHLAEIILKFGPRTYRFYERHGGKTIIIARFVSIIRTFAPFVAGIGKMSYHRFISYNVIGGVSWVALMLAGGYYFGNLPAVKNNFTLVVGAIIFISILPGVYEYLRQRNAPS